MNINWLRDKLNPLHVYCRVVDFGIDEDLAYSLCTKYEKFYKKFNDYVLTPIQKHK